MSPFPTWLGLLLAPLGSLVAGRAQANPVQTLAPDVYFHEGDHDRGRCNNGWVVFDDYVLVVDANFPAGAKEIIREIRAITHKPIRYVVDTHCHPDHAFGNQVWADEGATIVAHYGTFEELKNSGSGSWALSAKSRPDVAASRLKLPGIVFSDALNFDDERHRVELHWPGIAHTHGDSLVWLPHEKILFTGDLCVNGAYNYVHDSDIAAWIKVLEAAKKLGAEKICPGHGPMGGPELIADQQRYFIELRREVQALIDARKTPAEVKAAVPSLAAALKRIGPIARYVPIDFWFTAHVDKVYRELGGQGLPE